MKRIASTLLPVIAFTSVAALASTALASSHREAPAITEDPLADNTDVYAFISPTNPDNLVLVANYVPLLLPHSGPNFYRFADNVRYEFLLDNDGDAQPDIKYVFVFDTTTQNGDTFLYNTGPVDAIDASTLNVRQTYDLYRGQRQPNGWANFEKIVEDAPVAPWHVGDRSFPDGTYEAVAQQAISPTDEGGTVFAGPRDEPFFIDLAVFDLLGVAGDRTTDGLNVMSLVLEVPIDSIAADGERPAAGDTSPSSVVGVYARAKRPRVTIRRNQPGDVNFGGYVQVSRLAWPLINEVIIPLGDKDLYNKTSPINDVANFGAYILDPEVTGLLNAVLGAGCPEPPPEGRLDIVGLLSPNGTAPADLLRIDITEGQTFDDSAFPNGRKLADDAFDTMVTVGCGGGFPLGDAVDDNDLPFLDAMPYLASPHSGNPT